MHRYFKTVNANDCNILSWKSKGLSNESIRPRTKSNKLLNPSLDFVGTKARVKPNEDCLKQEKITFNYGKIVNIYMVYEIESNQQNMLKLISINNQDMDLTETVLIQLVKKLIEM